MSACTGRSTALAGVALLLLSLLFCGGGCNRFGLNQRNVAVDVTDMCGLLKLEPLPESTPIIVYVVKNALKGKTIDAPSEEVAVFPGRIPCAVIAFAWDSTLFDDTTTVPPYVVGEARRIARRLGCNTLVVEKDIKKTRGVWIMAFMAGVTRPRE